MAEGRIIRDQGAAVMQFALRKGLLMPVGGGSAGVDTGYLNLDSGKLPDQRGTRGRQVQTRGFLPDSSAAAQTDPHVVPATARRVLTTAEENEWTRLFQEKGRVLFRQAKAGGGVSDEEAEEIVGDAFRKTFTADGVEDRGKYASTAVKTLKIDLGRNRARRTELPSDFQEFDKTSVAGHEEQTADKIALAAALKELSPLQRQVINLRYFEGMRTIEIAGQLGKHPSAVSGLERRALAVLRGQLETAE